MVIASSPGASNREIAEHSGIADQGQISKLLNRLARLELVVNTGDGQEKGAANAWHLTPAARLSSGRPGRADLRRRSASPSHPRAAVRSAQGLAALSSVADARRVCHARGSCADRLVSRRRPRQGAARWRRAHAGVQRRRAREGCRTRGRRLLGRRLGRRARPRPADRDRPVRVCDLGAGHALASAAATQLCASADRRLPHGLGQLEAVARMFAALHRRLACRWWRRALSGQPSVALEVHLESAGVDRRAWLAVACRAASRASSRRRSRVPIRTATSAPASRRSARRNVSCA